MRNHNQKFLKKLDIFLLILFPIIATSVTLGLQLNYFWAILLFFGLPAFWLSLRTKKMIARTALFSLAFTIPFAIVMNYVAVQDSSWYVPTTVFPFRLLGNLPIEDIILGFLLTYVVVICYEHFLDKGKHNLIDKKMKYFVWPFGLLLIVFFALFVTHPELLKIKYAYFWIGTIFLALPIISTLSIFPKLLSKYLKVGSYFAILLAIFEYTGVSLNQWIFPGKNFVGWVSYFGYKIPVEEFVFWIFLSVIGILSYYEFFDDDGK